MSRLTIDRLRDQASAGARRRAVGASARRRGGLRPAGHEVAVESRVRPCVSRVSDHCERADDPGEEIVEVVRDAARELADRFHLLAWRSASSGYMSSRVRSSTRFSSSAARSRSELGLLLRRNVSVRAEPSHDRAALVVNWHDTRQERGGENYHPAVCSGNTISKGSPLATDAVQRSRTWGRTSGSWSFSPVGIPPSRRETFRCRRTTCYCTRKCDHPLWPSKHRDTGLSWRVSGIAVRFLAKPPRHVSAP